MTTGSTTMRTLTLCVLLIAAFFISIHTSAQQQRKQDPCERANETGVTVDLVECSLKKLADADTDLNRVYRQLMSQLGDKKWELKLRAAQQAWIKYRNLNCDFVSEYSGGGSASTFEYNFCLADMTTARSKELLEMLNNIKGRAGQ